MVKMFLLIISLVLIAFGCYLFFIDTLSIAEITGPTGSNTADIFLNLFDFDSGLTRYDMYRLAQKSKEWNARMDKILAIDNPEVRENEHEKLAAEMMRDPSFKKLAQRLLGVGGKTATSLLDIATSFKTLGVF